MASGSAFLKVKEENDRFVRLFADRTSSHELVLSDKEKIDLIALRFSEIMQILGLNLSDDSLKGTPRRIAKMYVKEIFSGLNPQNKPPISLFENKYDYNQVLIVKDITLYSYCAHHFMPIIGRVNVGYISSGQVIGLSKINRIVKYYGNRPQVQERLIVQIAGALKEVLNTEDVAVTIDATYLCVASRGIEDTHSSSLTAHYSGKFKEAETRDEFLQSLKRSL